MIQILKHGDYIKAGELIKKTNIDDINFPGLRKRRKIESSMFLSFSNKNNDINV